MIMWPLTYLRVKDNRLWVQRILGHNEEILPADIKDAYIVPFGSAAWGMLVVRTERGSFGVPSLSRHYYRVMEFVTQKAGIEVRYGVLPKGVRLALLWRVAVCMLVGAAVGGAVGYFLFGDIPQFTLALAAGEMAGSIVGVAWVHARFGSPHSGEKRLMAALALLPIMHLIFAMTE